MATAWVKGSASIIWTPFGGTEQTHLLAVPLGVVRAIRPSRKWGERHDWWAVSDRDRRTVTIGQGTREIVWTNRLENDPVGFMDMLEQALLYDLTLAYVPIYGGTQYPFRVVEVIGSAEDEAAIDPDRQRFGGGEWEGAFRARRTDGGTFDGLLASVSV